MGGSDDTGALIEVFRAWGESEAQLVRGLLETHDIASVMRGESTRLTHGFTLDGLAEVTILVDEADAATASEVIAQSEGMCACPRCGKAASLRDQACRFCKATLAGGAQT